MYTETLPNAKPQPSTPFKSLRAVSTRCVVTFLGRCTSGYGTGLTAVSGYDRNFSYKSKSGISELCKKLKLNKVKQRGTKQGVKEVNKNKTKRQIEAFRKNKT